MPRSPSVSHIKNYSYSSTFERSFQIVDILYRSLKFIFLVNLLLLLLCSKRIFKPYLLMENHPLEQGALHLTVGSFLGYDIL